MIGARAAAGLALVTIVVSGLPARAEEPAAVQPTADQVVAASPEVREQVAKDADSVPEFDKIRTPDSPAFTLLGITPTQIERPNTPKELVVALGTFVSKDSLTIPDKLAVEFSPYWIWSHPHLTLADYGRTGIGNIYRNLTISVGTSTATETQTDMAGMPVVVSNTDLAVGVRTHLYQQEQRLPCAGRVDGLREKLIEVTKQTSLKLSGEETMRLEKPYIDWKKLRSSLVAMVPLTAQETADLAAAAGDATKEATVTDAIIETRHELLKKANREGEFNRAWKRALTDPNAAQPAYQARKEKLVADAKDELAQVDDLFAKCAELEAARKGFLWDVAGAAAGRFPDASVDAREWLSWAVWTGLAWEGDGWSAIALGRFQRNKVVGAWDGFLDEGARLLVTRQRYALSLEAIARWHAQNAAPDEERWYYRVALAADYMVHDGSWLSVGIGKDFTASNAGSLFTLANLKWGFGGKPTLPTK